MKIKTIKSQHRRDIYLIYVCEHCGHEKQGHGYDDTYFHTQVIPNLRCDKCGEKAPPDYEPLTPQYDESIIL